MTAPSSRARDTARARNSTPCTRPSGIRRAVEPHQPGLVGPVVGLVGGEHGRADDGGADGVARVGERRDARPRRPGAGRAGSAAGRRAPSSRWSGARRRRRAVTPCRRAYQATIASRSAGDPAVAGYAVRIVGGAQGGAHHIRGLIDRRADRQVDDAVRVRPRALAVRRRARPTGSRGARAARAPVQCACGGSAATIGWSPAMTPILAAPPGEPMPTSSKNSTLAL